MISNFNQSRPDDSVLHQTLTGKNIPRTYLYDNWEDFPARALTCESYFVEAPSIVNLIEIYHMIMTCFVAFNDLTLSGSVK